MNIYACLDSDEDEKPKVKTTKVVEKKDTKKPTFEAPIERDPKSAPKKDQHSRHGAKDHHNPNPDAAKDGKKRQFDRRSGTGRGKEVAKQGAGGSNWGSDKLEALQAEKHIAGDAEAPKESVDDDKVVEVAEPVVPEPTVFTLDEYNRKRAEVQKTDSEAFSEVKLREVVADFSGLKSASNEGEADFITLGSAKTVRGKKDQRSGSKNVVLDVAFTAPPSQEQAERSERRDRPERSGDRSGRGDRPERAARPAGDRPERAAGDRPRSSGGRGGDRARGAGRGEGRGAPRADSGRGAPARGPRGPRGPGVDFTDANAFPSL